MHTNCAVYLGEVTLAMVSGLEGKVIQIQTRLQAHGANLNEFCLQEKNCAKSVLGAYCVPGTRMPLESGPFAPLSVLFHIVLMSGVDTP